MNEPKRIQQVYVFVRNVTSKYEGQALTEADMVDGKCVPRHLPPHYMAVSEPIFINVAIIDPPVELVLDVLDETENTIKAEVMEKLEYALSDIKDRRAQLLQLTHQEG